ncbi:MAG: response regulator transcription factor [Acidobacteria bacterium]|nr:response regulator transcription factor [Acidobacteriota bacterium]
MAKIRVVLVDDHALVRRGFRRLLEDDSEIEVAGEASDGLEAEEVTRRLQPDVVVLDYALPGQNGALTARKLLAAQPALKILMLSMHAEASYVALCREAGVAGYLLKNAFDLELVDAVKQVAAGQTVIDPRLQQAAAPAGKRRLSTREMEVLQHIAAGRANKEIATLLGLSANTIAVHRANIMDALEVHNAADLVMHAIRHGLVTPP